MRRGTLAVVLAGLLGVGIAVAVVAQSGGDDSPHLASLDPARGPSASDGAIQRVLDLTRDHDSMTYGAWFRARFSEAACLDDPADLDFTTAVQGPFSNGAFRYDVGAVWGEDARLHDDCPSPAVAVPMLGGVWSDTGEVVPLGDDPQELRVVIKADEETPDRDGGSAPEGPLSDFLAGEAP